ncbi:MAG: septal ring lytic transglycosylase RlpA family protein [Pleurocapsa sp. MO_192.B19]|nr:septal ring lytic transglycosylase RlpA family protein [Pleurocapsa sp. MO_192.B19]
MSINYLKNSKFLAISAFLSILNIGLVTSTVEARPSYQSLKSTRKMVSLKTTTNQHLDLDLASGFADPTQKANLKQQNNFELSKTQQIIPLRNQSLIANVFGGQASWYGPGFHGRLTANGEVYNQNAFTAAHPSLAFGTRVKVTNLNNGRSVVVRINDRGPYAGGRVIDVSAAAANSLGMINSGVAPVEVTILGK